MFGNDNQDEDISSVNPTLGSTDASTPADDAATADATVTHPADTPIADVSPVDQPAPAEEPAAETPEVSETPEVTEPAPAEEAPTVEETPAVSDAPASDSEDDKDLLDLKKQALEELTPLIDQLDQTPEEKFKTTMMMIQATDSSSLVKVAHETALKIEDEKVRAQALLDIVNEINYFTQPKE